MKGRRIVTGVITAATFLAVLIDTLELIPRAPVPGEIPGGGRPEPLAAVVAALLAAGIAWVALQLLFLAIGKIRKK